MPKMDGIEAVKLIRTYDENANIIMCSLQGQRANVMEAIKAGAKSYLVKPLKEDKLLLEIQKLQLNIATNMIRQGIALEVVMSCVELSQEEVEAFKKAYNL